MSMEQQSGIFSNPRSGFPKFYRGLRLDALIKFTQGDGIINVLVSLLCKQRAMGFVPSMAKESLQRGMSKMPNYTLPIILSDRPIAYHPILARACGGVLAGIFLSQILYWTPRGKLPGGWIWKTQADMEGETGLTRRNQETARRRLTTIGVLEEKKRGVPAKLHYRVNIDKLQDILNDVQTSLYGLDILVCPNRTNKDVQSGQSIPETTKENTYINDGIATNGQILPLIQALKPIVKQAYTNGRHQLFDDIALTLHGMKATPEQVKGFPAWWKANGFYKGKPGLNSVIDNWQAYKNGETVSAKNEPTPPYYRKI